MARPRPRSNPSKATSATVGYEAQLWQMADVLRGSMDADGGEPSLQARQAGCWRGKGGPPR